MTYLIFCTLECRNQYESWYEYFPFYFIPRSSDKFIKTRDLQKWLYWKIMKSWVTSFLLSTAVQTSRETAVNTFRSCLVIKNYAAQEVHSHVSLFVLFLFLGENPFDFVILPLLAQNSSKRETQEICLMKWPQQCE